MRIIRGLRNLKRPIGPSALTIGVFDGVHIGHRRIIGKVVSCARKNSIESVIVTFDPHPAAALGRPGKSPSLISLDHRIDILRRLGVDIVVVVNFAKHFASMSAERFVSDILIKKLGAEFIYTGDNFRFGRAASADAAKLKSLSSKLGIKYAAVPRVSVMGHAVSSSAIRQSVMSGDLKRAKRLLGRPISVFGTVIKGARFARVLGYPTANINPHHEVIPPAGVYAVKVRIGNTVKGGILNIGIKPTFYGPRDREPSIEAHIFDFKSSIYGREIEVYFIKKIRDEIAFEDAGALTAQIEKDRTLALQICKNMIICSK